MKAYLVLSKYHAPDIGVDGLYDREYYLRSEDADNALERMIEAFKKGSDYDSTMQEKRAKGFCEFKGYYTYFFEIEEIEIVE